MFVNIIFWHGSNKFWDQQVLGSQQELGSMRLPVHSVTGLFLLPVLKRQFTFFFWDNLLLVLVGFPSFSLNQSLMGFVFGKDSSSVLTLLEMKTSETW